MSHEIHRVVSFEHVAPVTLRVSFDDGVAQVVDFRPVLEGELYGPLRDPSLFNQVRLDSKLTHLFGLTARTLTRRRFTIGRRLEPLCAV